MAGPRAHLSAVCRRWAVKVRWAGASLTPPRWPHTQRTHRAQELLETTDDGIEHVAAHTGMGTVATVRRHFHRALGVPPDTCRRAFRNTTDSR